MPTAPPERTTAAQVRFWAVDGARKAPRLAPLEGRHLLSAALEPTSSEVPMDALPDHTSAFHWSDQDTALLVADILDAEAVIQFGEAKRLWVIARTIQRRTQSPPPVWVYLLVKFLEALIPIIVAELKRRYGDDWLSKAARALREKALPWQL